MIGRPNPQFKSLHQEGEILRAATKPEAAKSHSANRPTLLTAGCRPTINGDMSETIALFGGTFDPVHLGHLAIARAAVAELRLEKLILIPSAKPPHKTGRLLAPDEDRLAMCRLAVSGDPQIEVSDVELRSEGPSYTVRTLREFREQYGEAEIIFLVGADMLRDFHLWYNFEEIVQLARIVTMPRPGVHLADLTELRLALGDAAVERLLADLLATPLMDISSTEIRRRLKADQPIGDLVPPDVARYIADHRLYL